MAKRPLRICSYPGCPNLVVQGRCEKHAIKKDDKEYDKRRGTAQQRGYTYRWQQYTKWFLRQPENSLCKLALDDGCAVVSQCVDHIDPPDGPDDPRFWDPHNHQGGCIHCNSVKGKKKIKGTKWDDLFDEQPPGGM